MRMAYYPTSRRELRAARHHRNKFPAPRFLQNKSRRFVMRALIPLAVIISMAVVTPLLAQSLPDKAGPSLGQKDSTSQQESITNPGGFGKSRDMKAIDPGHTGSTGNPNCKQPKDIRTDRTARATNNMDCVR